MRCWGRVMLWQGEKNTDDGVPRNNIDGGTRDMGNK